MLNKAIGKMQKLKVSGEKLHKINFTIAHSLIGAI